LICHSFYTLDEYFEYSSWKEWLYTGSFYVLWLFIFHYFPFFIYLSQFLNYNSTDLVLCTAYFYWLFHIQDSIRLYGNKDDDDNILKCCTYILLMIISNCSMLVNVVVVFNLHYWMTCPILLCNKKRMKINTIKYNIITNSWKDS
jgi:hypothetical protein